MAEIRQGGVDSGLLPTPSQPRKSRFGFQRLVIQSQLWEPRQVNREPVACLLICTVEVIMPTSGVI